MSIPKSDPKPDSWPWERARRAVANMLCRVKYRVQRDATAKEVKRIGEEPQR